ncbi:sigma-70 family RNA polymerase sigma factor [Rheinheimera texasensis]|uniref:sigma-70 family RNA polymerase sigma factor n=1 Tax=Rheinheimera texasensis TaxID=306205 RepID=UPI000691FD51|nr:sigma-70 family RNA polymerase sigma factor [Rheinheimera texasensis]
MGWKWLGRLAGPVQVESRLLLQQYQQQADPALLQQLFLRYADALYHFLLQQSDAELAQDLSQQAWIQLMLHAGSYQGQSSVKTWLFSIGRNLLIDEWRRQRSHAAQELLDELPDPAAKPLQQLLAAEQSANLDLAIQRLPLLQREALLLQLEDFSLAQISEITGVGQETVKTRLRYARHQLQLWLTATAEQTHEHR